MARLIRMPRTIRARLTWILAIPSTLLLGVTGLEVAARYEARSGAHSAARQVELVRAAQELAHELQRERGLTVGLLGGEFRFRGELAAQRRRVDESRAALGPLLADPARRGVPRLRDALDRLGDLGAVRATADARQSTRQDAYAFYTTAIEAIDDALYDPDAGGGDPALRRDLVALWTLGRAQEAAAQERDTLTGVLAAHGFTPEEYVRFIEVRAAKSDGLARFGRVASAAHAGAVSAARQSRAATTMGAIGLRAAASPRGRNLTVAPREWWEAADAFVADLREVRRAVGEQAAARARSAEARAGRELVVLAVLGGVLLLATLLLGLVTARSILRPLRRLTEEADEIAERRLPEAVARVQATANPEDAVPAEEPAADGRQDEFAAVARSLAKVHRTALRLAAEQAVLRRNTAESLAHLGRRSQTLVRRQLDFIGALERDESDPAVLANLFELDHLATRMRRNAESLLVLVGERLPRPAAEPVAMSEVLRSALAEVEDYRRVVLRRVDHDVVRGEVVAEVAHLLAELIENALVFSPQDQDVEIQAKCDATEYHIAIVDQGVGMSPEELAAANARLRGEQSFLSSPTRRLGLYIVGRLAERLGIRVWLHDSPLAGITARVVLPADLLVRNGAAGAPAPAAARAGRMVDVPIPSGPGATPRATDAARPAAEATERETAPAGVAAAAPEPGPAAAPDEAAAPVAPHANGATAEMVAVVPVPEPAEPPSPGALPPTLPTTPAPAVPRPAGAAEATAPVTAAAAAAAAAEPALAPSAEPAAPPSGPRPRADAAAHNGSRPAPVPPVMPTPIPLHVKPPYLLSGQSSAGAARSNGHAAGDGADREAGRNGVPDGAARRTPRDEPGHGADAREPESPVERVRSMLNDYRAGTRPPGA
ncbi:hypothetical protein GCM10010106_10610 [Thermopolyspora flexuosa]|uniref:histidine kinase n=1 Tax=Thermopolyspora flexuosa TaxID=103836 RepID=A0A543J0I0_9ACTN|nr:sensor histidine kinase [Thermopolyspora flexuosa]TQM76313.1 signal transduction histidine kinase [Thermopolyspora flexuosa]GGM66449.1 hypothetical protein GCM10010106_10610 [Thermopolyspora flexuosa]